MSRPRVLAISEIEQGNGQRTVSRRGEQSTPSLIQTVSRKAAGQESVVQECCDQSPQRKFNKILLWRRYQKVCGLLFIGFIVHCISFMYNSNVKNFRQLQSRRSKFDSTLNT